LKVADFGCASENFINSTKTNVPQFTAPEVNEGLAYVGQKADAFAAGVVLFMIRTKKLPFFTANSWDSFYKYIYA